jgi:CheY-like chemotaxis protein
MPAGAILLSDDVMFTSRVTGTGSALGLPVRSARTADALLTLARQEPPTCVIVDLANPRLNIADLVARLVTLPARPRVVAYGSHVDAATLRAARDAGCDVVLPRSKFVEELPTALPAWLAPPTGGGTP